MNVLKEYQLRRLELADLLRAALNVARACNDEHIEGQVRSLLTTLAGDRLTLAIVGQFSRGKSTLINAMLGAAYLPTGVVPMTSVITTIRYGVRPRATFLRRDSRMPIEVPLSEVSRLVAQSSELRAELQVTSVDIELPAEMLRLGVAFVDTPGVGSAIGVNSAATRQFLPQADAIIFVTGFDSAFTDAEVEFLRYVANRHSKIFFVINKRDLVDEQSARQVVAFARRTLENSGINDPRIFELSALNGLAGKQSADSLALERSGVSAFETTLNDFLANEKQTLFLHNMVDRALNVVLRQRRDLQLGLPDRIGGDAAPVEAEFNGRLDGVRTAQKSTVAEIRARIRAALPTRLNARSRRWQDDLRSVVTPAADDVLAVRLKTQHTDPPQNTLESDIQAATDPLVRDWLGRRSTEVTEILIDLVSDQIGRLFCLARSPGTVGPELAGLSLPEDSLVDTGWAIADVPAASVPQLSWSVPIDHGGWAHIRATTRQADQRRRIVEGIDRGIVIAEEQARREFERISDQWIQDLASQTERITADEAARFQNNLSRQPTGEDISALDDVIIKLEDFQAGTRPWQPRAIAEPLASTAEATSVPSKKAGCVICATLRDTLIEYMSHSQYQLATRNRDQEAHAHGGGFCALHTWTYFTMASPLGISAGYAALAEATAQSLEAACSQSADHRQLTESVEALSTQSDRCAVCLRLAETERNAIAALTTPEETDAALPGLCLGHLALLCASEPSLGRARSAVQGLAAALHRRAEDMRSYALKREARYRSLITSEEAEAYRDTLHLLAGEPVLARPPSGEKDLEFPAEKN